jgi:hypothetical protein
MLVAMPFLGLRISERGQLVALNALELTENLAPMISMWIMHFAIPSLSGRIVHFAIT